MKETFYFKHDYNARNDIRIIALRSKFKAEGMALFWTVIEMLHEDEKHSLALNEITFISIADQSGVDIEKVENILEFAIHNLMLFLINDKNEFYSERVLRNIENRKSISEVRSNSAKEMHKRKSKIKAIQNLDSTSKITEIEMQNSANAMQNDIKKRKEKENKEKDINKEKKDKEKKEIKENMYFENDDLNIKYIEFLKFRKELKKQVTQTAIKEQVNKLKRYNPEIAIKMITNSIINGWQGIFELKEPQGNADMRALSARDSPLVRYNHSTLPETEQVDFLKKLVNENDDSI